MEAEVAQKEGEIQRLNRRIARVNIRRSISEGPGYYPTTDSELEMVSLAFGHYAVV